MSLRLIIISIILISSCKPVKPPEARRIPHTLKKFGKTRQDYYYWFKNRQDSAVVAYLQAENKYTEQIMHHTADLQEKLYQELIGRVDENERSAAYFKNGYYYYSRYQSGMEHPVYCRKKSNMDAPEEVMLDVNSLASADKYIDVKGLAVSNDSRWLAFGIDTTGRRLYNIIIKDLFFDKFINDSIAHTTGSIAWADDNHTFFYTRKDQTLRPAKVMRHKTGQSSEKDIQVFHEADSSFTTQVRQSKSGRYIFIKSESTLATEYQYVEAAKPAEKFRTFKSRESGFEYSLDHLGNYFYILTNFAAKNFRLMQTPIGKTQQNYWQDVILPRDTVLLEDFAVFKDYVTTIERFSGQSRLHILGIADSTDYYLTEAAPLYDIAFDEHQQVDSDLVRYSYSSLTIPEHIYDFNLRTRERTLVKQKKAGENFKSDAYQSKRVYALTNNGIKIPVSMVYRKDMENSKPKPLYLIGYGAYGITYEPYFRSSIISLLDRGFIFAIAHVRGGQYLGREWYENGRLLNKMNTFTDFADCVEYLVTMGYTATDKLVIHGRSAGGLLIGAAVNMHPLLFRVAIADVPFVDVLTTMLDPEIPLTTNEYDEWGNPNLIEFYDYISRYSPYDNVIKQSYPAILVTAAFHDSQVQYWEPAKWVAKLRDNKTDKNLLLLRTDFESGHGGKSGRYKKYRNTAFRYAFILDQLRMSD